MNANDSTQKMILQMNKLKSNVAGVIDAFSVSAVELQSRSFETVPQMKISMTMQSTADQMNRQIAEQTLGFVKKMRWGIQYEEYNAKNEQKKYDSLFKSVSDSMKENESTIKNGFQEIKTFLSNTKFKVKIESGLPTINSVRL